MKTIQKMTSHLFFLLTIVLSVSLTLPTLAQQNTQNATGGQVQQDTSQVVATFNGNNIRIQSLIREALVFLGLRLTEEDVLNTSNEELIALIQDLNFRKNLLTAAFNNEQITQLLNNGLLGLQVTNFRNNLVSNFFLEQLARSQVSEEAVRQTYDTILQDNKETIEYDIEILETASQSDAALARFHINNGTKTFSQAVDEYGIDNALKENGGKIGFIPESALTDEVRQTLKVIKPQELSNVIKTSPQSFAIVRYTSSRPLEIQPFENVQATLSQQMIREKQNEIIRQALGQMKIEIVK